MASQVAVRVHLDGSEACTFRLFEKGSEAFVTVDVVGADVALFAHRVEQLDQLAAVIAQARWALAVEQFVEADPVLA